MYHQLKYQAALEASVPQGCRWMDLGAGTRLHGGWGGLPQSDLAARASRLVGVDPDLAHLDQNPYLTERYAMTGDDLPFPDSSFDIVTANMVCEHLENPLAVFREVRRVLAPGGRFIFLTVCADHPVVKWSHRLLSPTFRSRLAAFIEGRQPEHVYPTLYRANTVADLTRLLHLAGMDGTIDAFQSSQPLLPSLLGKLELRMGWASNLIGSVRPIAPSLRLVA